MSTQARRESYDDDQDHRAKHSPLDAKFFDTRRARQHPVKFTAHFPLAAKKAVGKLTGRPTFAKAVASFEYFINTSRVRLTKRRWTSETIREHWLTEPWTEDDFVKSAKEWLHYRRKGFRFAEQKERILKVFRELGIKSTRLEMDNKPN
jgi:hypothetical protein